jgi:hypothetical protein
MLTQIEEVSTLTNEKLSALHERIMMDGASALQSGDMERHLSLHHEEFLFHVFGPPNLSGDFKGKASLLELYDKFRLQVGGPNLTLVVHDTLVTSAHGIWLIQFFPDPGRSEDHDTIYVVCEFHGDLIKEAWFVFWPKKMVTSHLPSNGH